MDRPVVVPQNYWITCVIAECVSNNRCGQTSTESRYVTEFNTGHVDRVLMAIRLASRLSVCNQALRQRVDYLDLYSVRRRSLRCLAASASDAEPSTVHRPWAGGQLSARRCLLLLTMDRGHQSAAINTIRLVFLASPTTATGDVFCLVRTCAECLLSTTCINIFLFLCGTAYTYVLKKIKTILQPCMRLVRPILQKPSRLAVFKVSAVLVTWTIWHPHQWGYSISLWTFCWLMIAYYKLTYSECVCLFLAPFSKLSRPDAAPTQLSLAKHCNTILSCNIIIPITR